MRTFYDARALALGGCFYVDVSWEACPHWLLTGASGSGKTHATIMLLGQLAKAIPDARVTLCDFKGQDFGFLNGCARFRRLEDCKAGLDGFFQEFDARKHGDPDRGFRLLVFDEWAAFCSMLDKKEAEAARKRLAVLLMLGRAFNFHVLLSMQRAQASYFDEGSRENLSVICALGSQSKEARAQFFSAYTAEEMPPVSGRGRGYLLADGRLHPVVVPTVRDMDGLRAAVRRLVE